MGERELIFELCKQYDFAMPSNLQGCVELAELVLVNSALILADVHVEKFNITAKAEGITVTSEEKEDG
jgi:hypothetical protein